MPRTTHYTHDGGPMPDDRKLPTPAEQWAEYKRRKEAWDLAYEYWKQTGKVGPPPPYPVRPHTPGWR